MEDKSQFLALRRGRLSNSQGSRVRRRFQFWSRVWSGGIYFLIMGALLIGAASFQLVSANLNIDNPINLVLVVLLSYMAIESIRNVPSFQLFLIQEDEPSIPDWPSNLLFAGASLILSALMFIVAYRMSPILTALPLSDAVNSGSILNTLVSLSFHIIFSGILVAGISGLVTIRFSLHPELSGLWRSSRRIMFERVLAFLNYFGITEKTLEEAIEYRCEECIGYNFQIFENEDGSRQIVCASCGRPKIDIEIGEDDDKILDSQITRN